MGSTRREPDPQDRLQVRTRDLASERWGQRMSVSMIAATAVHAAVFALWPMGVGPRPNLFMAEAPPEQGPPTFINIEDLPTGTDLASGTLPIPAREGPAPVDPDASGERPGITEQELEDLKDLRSRLVQGASYVPTISDSQQYEGLNGGPTDNSKGIGGARGVAAGTTGTQEFEALKGLSAIDLERLNALRPDVALEAASNWVLVRNPSEVWDYMRRHSDPRDSDPGTVQVALWVNPTGAVEWAEVVGSSGRQDLDGIALELFRKVVTFRPARLEGVPMPMSAVFTVSFPWF
jgi:TonB family protein